MPALNFKKQFANKVENGEKTQTIRATRKRPFRYGDKLYLYTGLRTKYCKKIGESVCHNIEEVEILSNGVMKLSGQVLNRAQRDEMATRDGFDNWNDMWLWFRDTHGFPFHGQLIQWGKQVRPSFG